MLAGVSCEAIQTAANTMSLKSSAYLEKRAYCLFCCQLTDATLSDGGEGRPF